MRPDFDNPKKVVETIQEAYYKITEELENVKVPRVVKVRGNIRKPIIHGVDGRIEHVARTLNNEVPTNSCTTERVKEIVAKVDPIVLTSQSAMGKAMLFCLD